MITDAVNTKGAIAYQYPAWATRLSDNDQPPKKEEQVQQLLHPVEVVQSAGGQELDYARLEHALTAPLINRTQPAGFSRMADVLLPDEDKTRIALGDYVAELERVNRSGESLTAQIHLRPYHFGDTLLGEYWQNPLRLGLLEIIKKNVQFNPSVDDVTLGNQSDAERSDGQSYLWIHPEAVRTSKAETYSGQTASKWTLEEAVKAIVWHCNPDETFITNPLSWTVLEDAPELEDVTLERGQYLPFYLDKLLHPLGFNWYVDYGNASGWKKNKPVLTFFKKSVGTEKQIYFQAPGSSFNPINSNCDQYSVNRSIGDQHNAVRVVGDCERREITIELYKAWSESDDSLTAEDLKRSDGASYVSKPTVRRLWIANEAGDITGLRTSNGAAGDPPDLTSVFTAYVPHRRAAEPPLTYQGVSGEKHRRDIVLEHNSGSGWVEFTGSFAIQPDQLGVLITEDELSDEAMNAERMRITCTIAGDYRIEGEAGREDHAVNGRDVWLELDMPQKFVDRQVQTTGDFASQLSGDADTQDDTAAIQTYAEKLRDEGGNAEIDCELVLPGIHLYYEIGDLITKIEGREIALDSASSDAPSPVYPQITKRAWRYDADGGPETVLTLDRGTRIVEENER